VRGSRGRSPHHGKVGGADFFDLGNGTFAGEDGQVTAKFAGESHAGRAGDGHLRGGVNGEIRRELPDEATNADVLHDGGVHAGGNDGAEVVFGVGQFVLENEGVESDVATNAALMEEFHELREVTHGEVVGAHPGVEFFKAEVDGVGAVFDGGVGAFPIAGR